MSYGLKYKGEYKRQDQSTTLVEIAENGYSGYVTEIKMVSCQVVQGNGNSDIQDVIRGTKLNLGIATLSSKETNKFDYAFDMPFENTQTELDFSEFYTQDETKYQVTMYRESGEIFFRGFILPDIFFDEYVDYTRIVNFTASDRLNTLVNVNLTPITNRIISNILINARDAIKLDSLPIATDSRFKETTGDVSTAALSEISVNENFLYEGEFFAQEPRNFDQVLREIAKTFFCNIFQWSGKIWFYSIVNPSFDSITLKTYTTDPESPVQSSLSSHSTDISSQMLAVPSIEGQPTARKTRVVFQIGSTRINPIENFVIDGDFEAPLQIGTWRRLSGPGGFVWQLKNWTYVNCDYSNQASRGPDGLVTTNYVVMHRQWQLLTDAEYIESRVRLNQSVDTNTILRFSLEYKGLKTNNSAKGFRDLDSFYCFALLIRNNSETHYLKVDNSGATSWTTDETIIRIRFTDENFGVWSEFVADGLVPPIAGTPHVRLYNTQQLGSTAKYRFHSAFDNVVVSSRANDILEDNEIVFEADSGQGYSSFAPDYEVTLGDLPTSKSQSALLIDGENTKVWAFNGEGSEPILAWVSYLYAQNATNPRKTINCRIRSSDFDITKGVIIDGVRYRVSYWELNDADNIWTLELQQVYN